MLPPDKSDCKAPPFPQARRFVRYREVKEGSDECQRYSRQRSSVLLIQAAFRGLRTRRHLKAMHLAATLIQRRFRTFAMRRKFLSLRKTAIWIQ